jgi:23S rRNA (pseudouridine1915-N3)-methyltransferase
VRIAVLPVGKIKSKPIAALADDYAARLSHYFSIELKPARDDRAVLERIEKGDFVVVLDASGIQMSSEELAKFLSEHQMRATKRLVFAIGGPDGVGDQLHKRASCTLSLSKMTFPHELAQAILFEQLYRAATILKGEPYHK